VKQHFDTFWTHLQDTKLESWTTQLPSLLKTAIHPENNGNLPRWLTTLKAIKSYPDNIDFDLNQSAITVSSTPALSSKKHTELESTLRELHPWRKGPFNIHGIKIDTEWRSDWKWARLAPHIQSLAGRRVLDVGCGNGYYAWRMAAEGAELVVGIDPGLLFLAQFRAIRHFMASSPPVQVLPLGIEAVPAKLHVFATVFSMGVLYH